MTLYKGNKVIAGSRSYIGNIGDIKYTTRVDLPFGGSWCDGSIKLKAQFPTVYQMLIDGKLQALDIATYESALNLNGSCGFFGLDTATESFRVPSLNDVYIKAGQDALEFGVESLPNITGAIGSVTGGPTDGAFYLSGSNSKGSAQDGTDSNCYMDASLFSSTYQTGAKVNPDHVKYRAYVVLYTGADTNIDITKEIQLNNPFFFGMSQYFEVDPKNASWLKSDGAFHSGAVYESFYNWLVSEYENPDKLPNKLNATVVGNPTISDGVASGFSVSNYINAPETFAPNSNWEMNLKITTSSDLDGKQYIFGKESYFDLYTSDSKFTIDLGNGSSWSANVVKQGSTVITKNTTYFIKYTYTDGVYVVYLSLDGVDYQEEIRVSYQQQSPHVLTFGRVIATDTSSLRAWSGTIDFSHLNIKINGKTWWSGYHNSVRKMTDDYSDYDFVLNTESNSFRLPVKTHLASGNAVCGNGLALGMTTGTENFGYTEYNGGTYANISAYGTGVGTSLSHIGGTTIERTQGVTTVPNYSGIETSSQGLMLYFYVGDVVSDAKLLNAGKVLDLLAKLESYDYVVEYKTPTAEDPNWYRKYKSGWIEQGGKIPHQTSSKDVNVVLHKKMLDTSYNFSGCVVYSSNAQTYHREATNELASKTTTGFTKYIWTTWQDFYWQVSGQGV